ncbi:hypothetical protein NG726_35980, partial [Pseudomonas sp. MOB-449]|nr:hypothetical protein [Pseudomonas sp. MOB-449]
VCCMCVFILLILVNGRMTIYQPDKVSTFSSGVLGPFFWVFIDKLHAITCNPTYMCQPLLLGIDKPKWKTIGNLLPKRKP